MAISEAWVDFLAGWASGAVAVLTCQPMDTVLTRLQAGTLVNQNAAQQITRGLVSNFGVSSLWRGSSPMISAVPFQNSLLMGGYGIGKQWAEINGTTSTLLPVFVGGCTGGIVQSFLMSPVEWIKVQTQVEGKQALVASRQLMSQWTRGLNATLLRDGIPHGVWFASYEWCKTSLEDQTTSEAHRALSIPLFSGAFAATLAWVSAI
jgi:solute carrier family 25 carnitine/acylcarnitine transporter 20/29